jgi:hypothetical protein
VSDERFMRRMRWFAYAATVGAVALYAFVLVPNYRACERETGHWRACIHWLVR